MTTIGEQAIARAKYQSAHGPRYGVNQCMMRTRMLFDAPAIGDYDGDGSPDAEDGWKFAKFKHPFNGDYAAVPRGVPFWWSGGSNDNGHVAPTEGASYCMSTDILRGGYYDHVPLSLIAKKWGLTPLGWTEDIDGVRVWTPPAPAKETAPVSSYWTRTRARLLAALNHDDAKNISTKRVAVRAFLGATRRALSALPKV